MSVTVTTDRLEQVMRDLRAMANRRVRVGIPAAENPRSDEMGNAALGYLHENGSPAAGIPPRPFLVPGVVAAKDKLLAVTKKGAADVLKGSSTIDATLTKTGLVAQASVKRRLVSSEGLAPLAPATIAARKAKGYQGEKPLIRTGQLLNSLTFVVGDK